MLYRARLEWGSLIVTEYNSKDLKLVVGVERSLQGSRRRNAVQPPTIKEVHELGTGRGVLMKVNPRGIASSSWAEVVLGEIQVSERAKISMLWED